MGKTSGISDFEVIVTVKRAGSRLAAKVKPATVSEGEKVTLTCDTTCTLSDHPTLVWFRDGHSVPNTEFQTSIQDAGRYQCAVQSQENLTSAPVSLNVQLVEGSSVNLTCSSHANPAVENYTWFKKDGTIHTVNGQYFCEARNREGAHKSTVVSLTIQGANQDTKTFQMPVYISSAATVFIVIILFVFLWMWKSPIKLCQKTAVDKEDDQNSVLSRRRTSNEPATQETRTEEQENALCA
eukprot:XP_014056866.1 PREDICTED: B-cell receptor CD22-like [Salmo salar]